ncbi:MAG: adenosylmethionine--8-amino-7-oxononanoate transaminase [Blastopirellula sp.]|nr:MAG: adenosylmethionine--8-amino-7-oxononanoate transaminase [Blastopirellula sp.]
MNTNPSQLESWDKEIVWHAFTQMSEYEPLIIDQAEGCTLIDIHGKRYLDGVSSLWCNVHGHRHPKIDAAIKAQVDKVSHVTNLGSSNTTTIQLAKRLTEIAPAGLEHVFFSSDGASAVEVALKMAFQYWQQRKDSKPKKTGYLAYADAYHGDTIGSVSVSGVAQFHAMFKPLLFNVQRLPSPNRDRLPEGVTPEDACKHHLDILESVLKEKHEEIAALVIEPLVQGAAGMIMQPEGYLNGVRELTKKYDVLMICDEVAVGIGRTGKMFACEHEQVEPDLLCLGKGLTGGYLPMSATLATTELWNTFLGSYADSKTFFHGHTFGGNPLSSAAAIASFDIFEEEQTLENLQPKIARLAEHLARIADHPHVGNVRQCGMMVGIELVKDRATGEQYDWTEERGMNACKHATDNGVWVRPLGNVIVLMPPLAISLDEIDQICTTVEQAIHFATAS